jgi:putative flippase GtrA
VTPGLARLGRYGISGCASALTQLGIGLILHERLHVRPVVASTAGFAASVAVSYALQHAWVFRSAATHAVAGSRFLTVTAIAFTLNTVLLWLGTDVLHGPYLVVQAAAILLIPIVNYSINSRWTFRGAT